MDAGERFLCLASYEKGHGFLRQCAEMGVKVTLLTLDKHRAASWPRESLEQLATMPPGLNREQILNTVSWMARGRRFDRVIALDECDLETAAQIREHMRVPGMGLTTAGCYRDKLAQRIIARAFGYPVLKFCRVLNYDELRDYIAWVPAPWLLKPRMDGSMLASRTIVDAEQLWRALDELGDAQSHYILEQIVPGDHFHVDSIVNDSEVKFSIVHQGGTYAVPIDGGKIFTTHTVDRASREAQVLTAINQALAPAFGMVRGVAHAAFLRSHADCACYFVEIGARVGGGFIDQVVETATGVDLWREWATLEIADLRQTSYTAPESFEGFAGSVVCSSQGTGPDLEAIVDPAIVARVRKDNLSGLIVRAASPERVQKLLDEFGEQFEGGLVVSGNSGRELTEQE
jgi:biotin carboxylase